MFVEALQGLGFGVDVGIVKGVDHRLHDLADRVLLSELVAAEQCFEHGAGDEVLGQHRDCVVCSDAVVEVVFERLVELCKPFDRVGVLFGMVEQRTDAGFLRSSDVGDVVCPVLHVLTVADFVDDACVKGISPFGEVGQIEGHLARFTIGGGRSARIVGVVAAAEADADD